VVVVLVGSVLFVCVGVGIVLLVGSAGLGLSPVRLTGVTGFTPFKSPGSEVGSSDCVGCVGFWVAVPVIYIGVPEGRDACDGGGLNMFTLLVSTKASCGPER
jgi:hypothetical protein